MTLYELSAQYADLMRMYESAEDEETRQLVLQEIDKVNVDIADKGEAYARMMRNAEASANAFGEEIKRLQACKRSWDAMSDRLKRGMLDALQSAGASELQTGIGKWRIQKNPWSVTITDTGKIPEKYLIPQEPTVDKRSMLTDFMETGEVFDGAEFSQSEGVRFR